MGDNDWVKLAMDDDSVVVDLLMCLHHSTPSPPKREKNSKALLPLEWRVRQRRSKPIPHPKAKKPTPTASPTTPLSWSGATSVSGGDGLEESSQSPPKRPESTRSKVRFRVFCLVFFWSLLRCQIFSSESLFRLFCSLSRCVTL